MKKTNKKASIEISFNMIFSIILIIVFILAASYAIKKFMNISQCSQIGIFKTEMQTEIDKAHASTGETFYTANFSIPSKITYICFADRNATIGTGTYEAYFKDFKYSNTGNNFFFEPMKYACDFKTLTIKNINIIRTTEVLNPYCIPVNNGKVSIKINKGTNDALVCIGNSCQPLIAVDENICRNANDANPTLCGGALDFARGDGYTQECYYQYGQCGS